MMTEQHLQHLICYVTKTLDITIEILNFYRNIVVLQFEAFLGQCRVTVATARLDI